MSRALPGRRFAETQWLIIAALALLFAMVLVEMQGMMILAKAAEDETRRSATTVAEVFALSYQGAGPAEGMDLPHGAGLAIIVNDQVEKRIGIAGPPAPVWWPWSSRNEWEKQGRQVAGPFRLAGGQVMVAYATAANGRAVRAVTRVSSAAVLGRWRWAGAALALIVAAAGGMIAIMLVGRSLAPYRALLVEAAKVAPGPGEEGEARFLVETFRNAIARLGDSEAALRQRVDELAVLAEVLTRESSSGVVISDPGGLVRGTNDVARELIGNGLETATAIPAVLLHSEERLTISGRTIEVRRFPLLSKVGEAQGEVMLLSDRTAMETMQRVVQEKEHMAELGELAAGMAHELRNALATIRGYVRLLPAADDASRSRYATAMDEESAVVGELLDRFLSFAQPRELKRERIDLLTLVQETLGKVASVFPAVTIELSGFSQLVVGDSLGLTVIFENLIRNGAEAVLANGGKVNVHLAVLPGRATVTVTDDGPGVAREVCDRLFQPFVSTKASGGMGLALARRFARLHGGDLECRSVEGEGACFVVILPLEEVG